MLNNNSGFHINNYVEHLNEDKSDKNVSSVIVYVSNHIKQCLDFHKHYEHRGIIKRILHKLFKFFNNGIYLTLSYLLVKLVYLASIFAQLVALNYWLRDVHYPVSSNLLFGSHNWNLADRFPRMILCKYY